MSLKPESETRLSVSGIDGSRKGGILTPPFFKTQCPHVSLMLSNDGVDMLDVDWSWCLLCLTDSDCVDGLGLGGDW